MVKNCRARYDDHIVWRQSIMQMYRRREAHVDDLTRQILQLWVCCEVALER